jgi:hypothetical protein
MNQQPDNDAHLDQWLKANADAGGASPSDNHWDKPDSQVWATLKQALDRKRKRRRLIWWFWTSIGVALILAVIGRWQILQIKQQHPIENPEKIAKQGETTPGLPIPSAIETSKNTTQKITWPTSKEIETPKQKKPDTQAHMHHSAVSGSPDLKPEDQSAIPFSTKKPEIQALTVEVKEMEPLQMLLPYEIQPLERSVSLPALFIQAPFRLKRSASWQIGLETGWMFTDRVIKNARSGIVPNGTEKGAFSLQWGVLVNKKIGPHWAIESGVQLAGIHIQADREGTFRYRAADELFDPARQVYTSAVDRTLETAYGAVDLRFNVNRNAGQPIPEQTRIRLRFRTDEKIQYLRIPLGLQIRTQGKRWYADAGIGIGLNIRRGYQLIINDLDSDQMAIRTIEVRASNRINGMSSFLTDGYFQTGINYQLNRSIHLQMKAAYRRGIQSMYRNGPFISYPSTLGLNLVLFRSF